MTPSHLTNRIRSALIRRLGGVPYDEYASVDHKRQKWEGEAAERLRRGDVVNRAVFRVDEITDDGSIVASPIIDQSDDQTPQYGAPRLFARHKEIGL
jgi:hypothetical protein